MKKLSVNKRKYVVDIEEIKKEVLKDLLSNLEVRVIDSGSHMSGTDGERTLSLLYKGKPFSETYFYVSND